MLGRFCFLLMVGCLLAASTAQGQSELWLHVTDGRGKDWRDVQFNSSSAEKTSDPTSDTGKTKLVLKSNVEPGEVIYLELQVPPEMKIVVPLKCKVVVPKTPDAEEVRICKKGDKECFRPSEMAAALGASVLTYSIPLTVETNIGVSAVNLFLRKAGINRVAKEFELPADYVEQTIQSLPTDTSDPIIKGIKALYNGKYAEAQKAFIQLLQSNDRSRQWRRSDVEVLLGESYLEQGKFAEAADQLKPAAEADRTDRELTLAYGISLYKSKQYEQSLAVWNEALKLKPASDSLYLNQGLTNYQMGRNLESIQAFQQALKLNPSEETSGRAYNYIGDAYFGTGNSDQALISYRTALKHSRAAGDNEQQNQTFLDIKALYDKKPDLAIALAYNEEFLISVRQFGDKRLEALLLSAIANINLQQNEDAKALANYREALKAADQATLTDGERIPLLRSYAAALHKAGRDKEAQGLEIRAQMILMNSASPTALKERIASPKGP